jgi:hypothetical protein
MSSNPIRHSTRYKTSHDVVFRRVGEEAILVPLSQNVGNLDWVYTLSPVAARVWQLVDGTRETGAIAATISEEFDVDETTATADVDELLATLADAGLVGSVE